MYALGEGGTHMPVGALGGLYPLELKLQASLDLPEERWELDLSSVKAFAVFTTESPCSPRSSHI